MKKTLLLGSLVVGAGVVFAGCQQTDQLKEGALSRFQKVKTENVEITKQTEVAPNEQVVKQTEVEIKKPADVDKVVKEIDETLNQLNEDELDLDINF